MQLAFKFLAITRWLLANMSDADSNSHALHPLLDFRAPPASLVALRIELAKDAELSAKAQQGRNFEECLAILAADLNIILDGMYDVPELCDVLVAELRARATIVIEGNPAKRDPRLMSSIVKLGHNSITIENKDLIIPERVRREQIEERLEAATQKSIDLRNYERTRGEDIEHKDVGRIFSEEDAGAGSSGEEEATGVEDVTLPSAAAEQEVPASKPTSNNS